MKNLLKNATIVAQDIKVIEIDGGKNKLITLIFTEDQRDEIIISIIKALKREEDYAQPRNNKGNP